MDTANLDTVFNEFSNSIADMTNGNLFGGIDEVSSNAIVKYQKAVLAEAKAEQDAEIRDQLWHATILFCAIATVLILWRIFRLKQIESNARQQNSEKPNDQSPKDTSHGNDSNQEAKESRQTTPTQHHRQQLSKAESARDDFSEHPDSRYMPKS